jgi:hypothetical protein
MLAAAMEEGRKEESLRDYKRAMMWGIQAR